jgi:flagella basal body P-ring formation protein FlgA
MLTSRFLAVFAAAALAAQVAQSAEPVVVDIRAQTKLGFTIVTIGDVAQISGGEAAIRDRIAHLDLADLKPREQNLTITRRAVEYRLRIAGIDAAGVQVIGAERASVTLNRRTITSDEVVAAARTELLRGLSVPRESVTVELARPIVVRLPEVATSDPIIIAAAPHSKTVGIGRVKVDVDIYAGEEKLLSLGVDMEIKPLFRPADPTGQFPGTSTPPVNEPRALTSSPVIQASATSPINPTPINPTTVLVRPRQQVMMLVHMGGLNVSAVGEAQQEGRLGQVIPVQNVDSKKTINAKVTGPGTVEIELESRQP